MKYLYMIFRLFKCPHKYEPIKTLSSGYTNSDSTHTVHYISKCKKCGKLSHLEIGA